MLITGLIFTVILTLIVLAGVRTGILEERMASNARNRQLALQAAEAVLRDGETSLLSTANAAAPFDPFTPASFKSDCTGTTADGTGGLCAKPAAGSTPRWKTWTDANWTSSTLSRPFASNASNISSTLVPGQPRYFVELMSTPVVSPSAGGGICPNIVYRLSARGLGQDSTTVYVQSYYRMRPQFC